MSRARGQGTSGSDSNKEGAWPSSRAATRQPELCSKGNLHVLPIVADSSARASQCVDNDSPCVSRKNQPLPATGSNEVQLARKDRGSLRVAALRHDFVAAAVRHGSALAILLKIA